jgi:tetratricopeptide (TPR) repeat protein
LLQAIAEVPEDAVQRGLAHLQAAEFLYEARLFPEQEYTFKHALTHEVAYGGLLHERRRALHARLAEALEALASDQGTEQVERLAHHALRGEIWDKALAYLRQAGDKALGRSVYHEAVGYCEQALRALQHLPETRVTREQAIDLRLVLRSALVSSGGLGRALVYLREAEALAMALDDAPRLGRVSRFLARHFHFRGAYGQALTAAQRALALAAAGGDAVLHALTNQTLGLVYQAQGDYRRAIDCCEQTMAFFDEARHRERFGQLVFPAVLTPVLLAVCYAELGMFAEGRALAEEGLRIAETVDHPLSLMTASWGLGLLALRHGDLPRALRLLERAVHIGQEAHFPHYFPQIAPALGAAYTLAGRLADAVPLLMEAMEQTLLMEAMEQTLLMEWRVSCGLSLGEAQMLTGCLDEAHTLTERTLALTRAHQAQGNQAYTLRLLGDIAAHRHPPDTASAETHYRQALALAEELGMRPLQAHCHRGLGTLYAMTGQHERARTALSTAIALYRDMAMTFWLPQTEVALAQVEGR